MIKFFRHIRKSFLEQNKMGKYFKYAFGEIVLVVIGILIALQINNWNENRKDRIREVKYLTNIKHDLQRDLVTLDGEIDFREKKFKKIGYILNFINKGEAIEINQLASNVYFTLMERKFTPNNSTFNELSSSGNLSLISNDSIKKLLLELEESYNDNIFSIEHETYEYREFISKSLFKYTNLDLLRLIYLNERTAEEQGINIDSFQELLQNKEYKNGLVITRIISKNFIGFYSKIKVKSEKVIQLIDTSINQRDD